MTIWPQIGNVFALQRDRLFLIEAPTGRRYTYGEFYDLASRAAGLLQTQGVGPGDRVAVVLANSPEFAALYFGCLFLGAVIVPVNPTLHPREVNFILAHSGAKCILCSPATEKLVDGIKASPVSEKLLLVPFKERDQHPDNYRAQAFNLDSAPPIEGEPQLDISGDGLFSINFTSGTTSLPKGVAHKTSCLLENARIFNTEMAFNQDCCFLHVMPMGYMAGFLNTLLSPFMAGASIVLCRAFDAQTVLRFWQPVMEHGADTFWLSPTMVASLLRLDRDRAGLDYCQKRVKTVCVGTAPLPLSIKRDFEAKYNVPLMESYGLSELLLVAGNSSKFPRVDGSVGRLLPGIEARISDEQAAPQGLEKNGEIWIRTPYLMAGYLNYQTLEPDFCNPGDYFPTGDLGHLAEDGHLFITGRKKDLIIRGGINVSPRSIEEILLQHGGVEQVAVFGLPDDFYGEEVVAVVKVKPGYGLETIQPALVALCRENLSPAAVPTRFFAVSQFPESTMGKIQKAKLREMFSQTGAAKG